MASHGSSIFTSKMGTAEERAKKSSLLHFYFSVSKKKQHFYGCCCQYNPGMMMAWELSFSSLLPCFRPFFSCETKTGSRFINVILRGVYSALQMPDSFHHHESLIPTHLYSASILSFLPRYIFWQLTRGSRWHSQQSCHLIRTRYIFNSVSGGWIRNGFNTNVIA